jgi:ER-derived vesicles protein
MLAGSYMVIARKHSEIAVGALFAVVVSQALGYGLVFDVNFFFRHVCCMHSPADDRNLSVIGGLLMVLSDSLHRRKIAFAGLPQLSDPSSTNRTYFQLAGRILLIFLFLGLFFRGDRWTATRMLLTIIGLLACVMVAVGFKAKYSAMFLVALLSVFNVLINNFWSVHSAHPHRDFLKYCISGINV